MGKEDASLQRLSASLSGQLALQERERHRLRLILTRIWYTADKLVSLNEVVSRVRMGLQRRVTAFMVDGKVWNKGYENWFAPKSRPYRNELGGDGNIFSFLWAMFIKETVQLAAAIMFTIN